MKGQIGGIDGAFKININEKGQVVCQTNNNLSEINEYKITLSNDEYKQLTALLNYIDIPHSQVQESYTTRKSHEPSYFLEVTFKDGTKKGIRSYRKFGLKRLHQWMNNFGQLGLFFAFTYESLYPNILPVKAKPLITNCGGLTDCISSEY